MSHCELLQSVGTIFWVGPTRPPCKPETCHDPMQVGLVVGSTIGWRLPTGLECGPSTLLPEAFPIKCSATLLAADPRRP